MITSQTTGRNIWLRYTIDALCSGKMFPTQAVTAAKDGVDLCLNVILPSSIPIFCAIYALCRTWPHSRNRQSTRKGNVPFISCQRRMFRAFPLGIIGGYPVGARTAIELYQKGQSVNRYEAERLLRSSVTTPVPPSFWALSAPEFSPAVQLDYGFTVLT